MGVEAQGGGALPRDANKASIPVASQIDMQDATGTPQVSPLTVADTALEVVIPTNAILCTLSPAGADLRFGDNATLDGTSGNGYFLLPDGEDKTIPVADGNSFWVVRDAGVSVTLSFFFEIL